MTRPARPRWSTQELNILRRHFEAEGAAGCMSRMKKLATRGEFAVKQVARKLGLKEPRPHSALIHLLTPAQVDEAIRLHDDDGIGFGRIGARFGVCEATVSNAYYAVMCVRRGYRPAVRDQHGSLVPAEIERLRAFLRKGTKAVDIQLYMAISASTVSNERRRYNVELKARGKRPLPPPGGGAAYSGVKVPKDKRKQVEDLYLEGKGAPEIERLIGVSKTTCIRIREKLVRRLARKGQALPGCDGDGTRRHYPRSRQRVPEAKRQEVRTLLMQGVSHLRATRIAGIGDCSAYKIRGELKAELEARGEALPPVVRVGRGKAIEARWLPPGQKWVFFYRILADEHGDAEARRMIAEAIAAIVELPRACARAIRTIRARRPLSFEEQLARVGQGAGIVARLSLTRAAPDITLGGIATAQL